MLHSLRSLEQALADLIAKRDRLPENNRERADLERMIAILEAERRRRE